MKSCLNYIDKAIKTEINKIIKEQDEKEKSNDDILATFDSMNSFIEDETKQSDMAVKNSLKLMSSLSEPTKRNAENLNIKSQKERMKKLNVMKKSVEDQKKNFEDNLKKQELLAQNKQKATAQISAQAPSLTEQDSDLPELPAPQLEEPIKKAYIVKFDKNTQEPFDVKFSERGFSIQGTRLSFEALENALSKNYTIVLNNGSGLALNAIRMQKILKYKDKWY